MINSKEDLKRYREDNNLSMEKLAKKLGYANRSSIWLLENGKRKFTFKTKLFINNMLSGINKES